MFCGSDLALLYLRFLSMDAVQRLQASGLFYGEWESPTAEAAAQAACLMRSAAAVADNLRALFDAEDRAAASERSRSACSNATPGTTQGVTSNARGRPETVTLNNPSTGVSKTLHFLQKNTPRTLST